MVLQRTLNVTLLSTAALVDEQSRGREAEAQRVSGSLSGVDSAAAVAATAHAAHVAASTRLHVRV